MKILTKRQSDKALERVMGIAQVIADMPRGAFGNSADASETLTRVYYNSAELAYAVAGTKGLNQCISYFSQHAHTMDDVLAISKAHLRVIKTMTLKEDRK